MGEYQIDHEIHDVFEIFKTYDQQEEDRYS